jgi:hypothetical protein
MTATERIAELEALVAQQGEQIAQLRAYIGELEGRLAKDSHNRSKPPTSDGLRRKTRSLRRPSGKKPGGQLGHRGETPRRAAEPDGGGEHRPTGCPPGQTPLREAPVLVRARRQVSDRPPVRLVVPEHQAPPVPGPTCRAVSGGAFASEAPSRAPDGPHVRALAV